MIIYRRPTPTDAQELLQLGTRMTEGTAFAPPTLEKVNKLIARPSSYGYGECAVADGVIVGFFCGYVGETYLNNQINAYEQGVFIAPEYRGGSIAFRMVKNFEAWARAKNAENVWMGQSVGQKQDSTLRFFERLGYACQGFMTHKKL